VIAGQATETAESTSYPEHCALALPTIEHDLVAPARETTINFDAWHRVHEGTSVLVDSLAALQRAVEVGASFDVGPHLPITNRVSLAFVASLGANRVWLSPELTLSQIKELAYDKPCELGLFVMGAQEVMICEHCLLMSQGECTQECTRCARRKSPHFLQDRKNFEFPVVTDMLGRSHLYNSVPLDVVSAMPDLLAAGVSSFLVDTTLMNSEESYEAAARVRRAVRVAQNDGNTLAKMPDTTTGHLFRGVS
jgi:U32 family peptidase